MKKKNVIILAISFLCIAITFLLCTVCYSKDNRTRVIVRDVHVAHHLVNTWIEGNENFAQYEFKITNYTNKTIDDFEIDYNLVSDKKFDNYYCISSELYDWSDLEVGDKLIVEFVATDDVYSYLAIRDSLCLGEEIASFELTTADNKVEVVLDSEAITNIKDKC